MPGSSGKGSLERASKGVEKTAFISLELAIPWTFRCAQVLSPSKGRGQRESVVIERSDGGKPPFAERGAGGIARTSGMK